MTCSISFGSNRAEWKSKKSQSKSRNFSKESLARLGRWPIASGCAWTRKPIHPIGGVADCLKALDVSTYVDATKASGSIGGSLYDFQTIEANPERDAFWSALARLNG